MTFYKNKNGEMSYSDILMNSQMILELPETSGDTKELIESMIHHIERYQEFRRSVNNVIADKSISDPPKRLLKLVAQSLTKISCGDPLS